MSKYKVSLNWQGTVKSVSDLMVQEKIGAYPYLKGVDLVVEAESHFHAVRLAKVEFLALVGKEKK